MDCIATATKPGGQAFACAIKPKKNIKTINTLHGLAIVFLIDSPGSRFNRILLHRKAFNALYQSIRSSN
jgi:hypothetical protein